MPIVLFIFHFCRIFAAVHPPLRSFGSSPPFPFIRQFTPSPFIRHFPFCIRQAWRIGNAASPSPCFLSPFLCPLRRNLIPTKTPPESPFRPENLIILTFSCPQICTYQKKCVPLHRKVRIGVPDGGKRSASGGESGGIGCPFI